MIECKICKKEYKDKKGLTNHISRTHKISSKEYYDKYYKKEKEGYCKTCTKETNYIGWKYNIYCSRSCKPDWKKGKEIASRIEIKCDTCENIVRRTKKEIGMHKGNYCSYSCMFKNPNWKRRTIKKAMENQLNSLGKLHNYKNINFRSKWEVEYAKFLDAADYEWKYEPCKFELKNGKIYIPDFWRRDKTTGLWNFVEIKGYWREDAKEKVKLLGGALEKYFWFQNILLVLDKDCYLEWKNNNRITYKSTCEI